MLLQTLRIAELHTKLIRFIVSVLILSLTGFTLNSRLLFAVAKNLQTMSTLTRRT